MKKLTNVIESYWAYMMSTRKRRCIIYACALCVLVFVLVIVCIHETKTEKAIAAINEERKFLPFDVFGQFDSVKSGNDSLLFNYIITDSIFSFKVLSSKRNMAEKAIIASVGVPTDSTTQAEIKQTIKLFAKKTDNIIIRYKDTTNASYFDIPLNGKSIIRAIEQGENSAKVLSICVKMANYQLPYKLSEGITLKGITLDKGALNYDFIVDESLYKIVDIINNTKALRDTISRYVNSPLNGNNTFKHLCKRTEKGILYRFWGDVSRKQFYIEVPYSKMPSYNTEWTVVYKPTEIEYVNR